MTSPIKAENILFVDDEESILEVAKEFFTIRGYKVFTAQNGEQAYEILKSTRIDCCFTDINMPVMNGIELAEKINRLDNTIPVVIMTGFPSLENTLKTLKNGVVDFLIKPVNLNHMELCIQRVLQQRRLFVENILLKEEAEQKARLEELNRELTQKVKDLKTMNRITNEFLMLTSSTDVFDRLVRMAVEISKADAAMFHLIHEMIDQPVLVSRFLCADDPAALVLSQTVPPEFVKDVGGEKMPFIASPDALNPISEHVGSLMASPLTIRGRVFGVLTAAKMPEKYEFEEKDLFYLSVMTSHAAYAIENLALYENIYQNLFSTIYAFVRAIGARDSYTEHHCNRVTRVARMIAEHMGCSEEELDILYTGGLLHDIGKIGIRDEILLKPARLTEEEYEIIKTHTTIGANIVGQIGLWEREQGIIRHHHERYDGKGYPDGLSGEAIPYLARVLTVADVYDALASDRTYRRRMSEEKILQIIREGRGTQFDPQIVDVFLELYQKGIIQQHDSCPCATGNL